MNYSHYMTYPHHRDPKAFEAFIHDVQTIIEHAPEGAELCGRDQIGQPIINNELLIIGSLTNESPFSILRISNLEPWPSHRYPMLSVRTDKHPYDSVICACLLAFCHHFPAAVITTDGTAKDWTMGIALYEFCTERLAPLMEYHNE